MLFREPRRMCASYFALCGLVRYQTPIVWIRARVQCYLVTSRFILRCRISALAIFVYIRAFAFFGFWFYFLVRDLCLCNICFKENSLFLLYNERLCNICLN